VPAALIEIIGPSGSLGDWVVSDWTSDDTMIAALRAGYEQQVGPAMTQKIIDRLTQPQSIAVNGKTFTFALRPERVYLPFSLELRKATHTVYEGTEIPKDFRSRVQLRNPKTGENREVEISMNHPLRYAGLTFYQYQMDAGEAAREAGRPPSSVLEVVHNPSWLTPYVGCALVGLPFNSCSTSSAFCRNGGRHEKNQGVAAVDPDRRLRGLVPGHAGTTKGHRLCLQCVWRITGGIPRKIEADGFARAQFAARDPRKADARYRTLERQRQNHFGQRMADQRDDEFGRGRRLAGLSHR
jgi:hypothetical protein